MIAEIDEPTGLGPQYQWKDDGTLEKAVVHIGPTIRGRYLQSQNRFLAMVEMAGKTLPCFLPNPGRMHELLNPGCEMILKEVRKRGRKTMHDIVGLVHERQRISIDARVPNKLIAEALRRGTLEEFSRYPRFSAEFRYGRSRIDFWLTDGRQECLLEVKSCTLVDGGTALFPDAVTERGRRHVNHLSEACQRGYRACIMFLIQRMDADVFSTNDKADPRFGHALRRAAEDGVEVCAYSSELAGDRIILRRRIRVDPDITDDH